MATVAYIDLSEVKSFGNMSAEFFCNTDKKTRDRVAKMTSGEISSELSKVAKSITELYSAFPEIVGEISKSIIGETIRVYTSTSGNKNVGHHGFTEKAQLVILMQIQSVLKDSSKDSVISNRIDEMKEKIKVLSKYFKA